MAPPLHLHIWKPAREKIRGGEGGHPPAAPLEPGAR